VKTDDAASEVISFFRAKSAGHLKHVSCVKKRRFINVCITSPVVNFVQVADLQHACITRECVCVHVARVSVLSTKHVRSSLKKKISVDFEIQRRRSTLAGAACILNK
jgi:hypothetical protein